LEASAGSDIRETMSETAIATAEDAAALLADRFAGLAGEMIVVLHLGEERQVLAVSEHPGSRDGADLPLRAIVAESLRLDARAMIVAHNHPSGDARPSDADVEATRILAETARRLDLRLLDHLIFAGPACTSFRALGLL
jgi:DNA repair protein RadC